MTTPPPLPPPLPPGSDDGSQPPVDGGGVVPVLPYLTPIAAMPAGVWRQGKVLVVSKEAQLPAFCVKCDAPCDGRAIRKKYWWHHPAWLLLIFVPSVGLILCIIVILVVRKSGVVHYSLCPAHRRDRFIRGAAGTVLAVGGVAGFIYGALQREPAVYLVLGFAGFALGLVLVMLSQSLRPKRIDDHYMWLRGAGPAFLARFGVA